MQTQLYFSQISMRKSRHGLQIFQRVVVNFSTNCLFELNSFKETLVTLLTDRFTITTVALMTPQFKAISDCRQREFCQPVVNQNKHGRKGAATPVGQTLALCKQQVVFKRSCVLLTQEER